LVAVSLGLLVVRRKAFRKSQYWRRIWRSDLFLFVLWIVLPYLVFSLYIARFTWTVFFHSMARSYRLVFPGKLAPPLCP